VNCYPFIEAEKASNHNVTRDCEQMLVSRSAYYTDRTNPGSRHDRRDIELTTMSASAPTATTARVLRAALVQTTASGTVHMPA
jgi:hypothetical protein